MRSSSGQSGAIIGVVDKDSVTEISQHFFSGPSGFHIAVPQERVPDYLSISAHAGEVFGHRRKALWWLSQPHPALSDRAPFAAIQTPEGLTQVEDLLGQIQHGIFA